MTKSSHGLKDIANALTKSTFAVRNNFNLNGGAINRRSKNTAPASAAIKKREDPPPWRIFPLKMDKLYFRINPQAEGSAHSRNQDGQTSESSC